MGRSYVQFSPEVCDQLWSRLGSGMAAKPAARELGMSPGTVRAYLVRCGGIRPVSHRRAPCRLSLAEREEISRGMAEGVSVRVIAARLGRAPSTVSREVTRNGGRARYRAVAADRSAWARAARLKGCKLAAVETGRVRELPGGRVWFTLGDEIATLNPATVAALREVLMPALPVGTMTLEEYYAQPVNEFGPVVEHYVL